VQLLRPLLGYTKSDHQRIVDRGEKLKVQSTAEEIQTYHKNWKEHVERMQEDKLPKLAFKYKPVKKQNI
jgi:uncharacterized protein YaaR (DUF327 family)